LSRLRLVTWLFLLSVNSLSLCLVFLLFCDRFDPGEPEHRSMCRMFRSEGSLNQGTGFDN